MSKAIDIIILSYNIYMETITNGQYIKSLISTEEYLYQKFREIQNIKEEKIIEMLAEGEVRCSNCKSKIQKIRNSFFDNNECYKCTIASSIEKNNRKDIYKNVNNKWKKCKYLSNGWWHTKFS